MAIEEDDVEGGVEVSDIGSEAGAGGGFAGGVDLGGEGVSELDAVIDEAGIAEGDGFDGGLDGGDRFVIEVGVKAIGALGGGVDIGGAEPDLIAGNVGVVFAGVKVGVEEDFAVAAGGVADEGVPFGGVFGGRGLEHSAVGAAGGAFGEVFGASEGGDEDGDKESDDGHDDKEFNQSKGTRCGPRKNDIHVSASFID